MEAGTSRFIVQQKAVEHIASRGGSPPAPPLRHPTGMTTFEVSALITGVRAVKPIAVVPTLCTLGNAFCGFLAISKGADAVASLSTTQGPITAEALARFRELMETGCWLIFLAMVFDALDGRIARMTHQTSDFGAFLDSLTDMLTFGAAPALLLKFLFESMQRIQGDLPFFQPKVILLLTVLYVCCAALRLARFTAETDDDPEAHDFFQGLPTPAAAGLLCSSMLFYLVMAARPEFVNPALGNEPPGELYALMRQGLSAALLAAPLLGLLMVSKVRYIHLVNRYMRGKRPYTYVAQIVFVLFLLALWPRWALFASFVVYVVTCPILTGLEEAFGRRIVPRTEPPS